tara:strand:- start:740 stop:1321 length:582 start_codon:yes stop_codon:yes gene_type:complete
MWKPLVVGLLTAFILLPLPAEDILPITSPVSHYRATWENSAFSREVVKASVPQVTSTFGNNLVLEGIVHDDSIGAIAYMRDLSNNQPIVVTSQKSDTHPYTVVSANEVNDPRDSLVKITDGQEFAEISYENDFMTSAIKQPPQQKPTVAKGGASMPAGGEKKPTTTGNSAATNGAATSKTTGRSRRVLLPARS